MDTNAKKQKNGQPKAKANPKPKTVKGVFNSMLTYYVSQMKRENFYVDGYCYGPYKLVVDTLTREIEQDFSKASEYAKILEVADRFYKKVLDKKVLERVIDEDMQEEEFMAYYGDEILGEYKRRFDRSHNYIKGLITLGEEKVTETTSEDKIFRSVKVMDMDGEIPYTEMESIFERARQNMQKRKLEEDKRKPTVATKNALDLKEKDNDVFVFDHQGGQIVLQKVGELEYTVGNIRGNKVSRYRVRKEMEGKEPSEQYVFSNIDLYKMGGNIQYCEAVLGELLSDNNISKSNVGEYIGEISDDLAELKKMKIGDEIDDVDYIYKTPYKSSKGKDEEGKQIYYGLVYDAQDLSAVVEWEKQQEREKQQAEQQPKNTPKKEEKPEDDLEL